MLKTVCEEVTSMAEHATRRMEAKAATRKPVRRDVRTGRFLATLATSLEVPSPRSRQKASRAIERDAAGRSPYLQELQQRAKTADHGESIDSTEMADGDFLRAFLGIDA